MRNCWAAMIGHSAMSIGAGWVIIARWAPSKAPRGAALASGAVVSVAIHPSLRPRPDGDGRGPRADIPHSLWVLRSGGWRAGGASADSERVARPYGGHSAPGGAGLGQSGV